MTMRCGIEFEYMLVERDSQGRYRIRDFSNLDFRFISEVLANKPGCDDPLMATGDLGIRRGYWYLEGDERFHEDGSFNTLAVKGIEIRTPPCDGVETAIHFLLHLERQLVAVLAGHGLQVALTGFNPEQPHYLFTPPLNVWEQTLRAKDRDYDGSHITTLTYGPDINLSFPDWDADQSLDAARKLNAYAPYIVPFSFSSPFYAGTRWPGCSKRTFERAPLRPTVKLFLDKNILACHAQQSRMVYPARLPVEHGRIEFKAFDAHPNVAILRACCYLLKGICLADTLSDRSEETDIRLFQQAALHGFEAPGILSGSMSVIQHACVALKQHHCNDGVEALALLQAMLKTRETPSMLLLDSFSKTGRMFMIDGLAGNTSYIPEQTL